MTNMAYTFASFPCERSGGSRTLKNMNDLSPTALAECMSDTQLTPKQLGALGERYTATLLTSQGWTLLDRNWHTRYGELDLVMLDAHRMLVFVEVKTRRSTQFGSPQEAVTVSKQMNLRRAAIEWLTDPTHHIAHAGLRFDVVSIAVVDGKPRFNHIENAF